MVNILEVEYNSGNVLDLMNNLDNDLSNTDMIRALARLPEPSKARKYRDILFNIFRETGFIYAIIVIEFKDGIKKNYVFYGKSLIGKEAKDYIDAPIYTEGYLVVKSGDKVRHIIYNPYTFPNAKELFKRIREMGDKFRLSDFEVYLERITEYIDLDIIL